MADNDDTEQVPKILTFEPLGYLANQSPSDDSTSMNIFLFKEICIYIFKNIFLFR